MKEFKTDRLCFNHVFPLDKLDAIDDMSKSGEYSYAISYACDGDVFEL